jgi:hypothetical protein
MTASEGRVPTISGEAARRFAQMTLNSISSLDDVSSVYANRSVNEVWAQYQFIKELKELHRRAVGDQAIEQ